MPSASGWGGGAAQRRRSLVRSRSIGVGLAHVVEDVFLVDVPAAGGARRCLLETAVAVERTAEEELLQPDVVLLRQRAGVERQVDLGAAAVAGVLVVLADQRSVVVVNAARHHTLAGTERTGRAELSLDGAADEGALVGERVEQVGQVFLNLEGDYLGLRCTARRHEFTP